MPQGKEPKIIQVLKTITWGSVLVLVLIEIFVSLKVGGAPFKFGQVTLPDKPPLWLPGAGVGTDLSKIPILD